MQHFIDERVDCVLLTFRLDLDDIVTNVTHEAMNVKLLGNSTYRFAKEHALHAALNFDVYSIAHRYFFIVDTPAACGVLSTKLLIVEDRL